VHNSAFAQKENVQSKLTTSNLTRYNEIEICSNHERFTTLVFEDQTFEEWSQVLKIVCTFQNRHPSIS